MPTRLHRQRRVRRACRLLERDHHPNGRQWLAKCTGEPLAAMPEKLTAPRGTSDLLPPESARWSELEARIHRLATTFGYAEIRTPIFESTQLFVRGVGEQSD